MLIYFFAFIIIPLYVKGIFMKIQFEDFNEPPRYGARQDDIDLNVNMVLRHISITHEDDRIMLRINGSEILDL